MMHSFRMRYIVLGLLIYLQSAFCRTCGSEFEDIASKAVLATTVFEGTVLEKSVNISSSELYNATFEVIKTFKGDLPKHRRKYLQVTVGVFGPEHREQCNTRVDIGSHYIVFLNTSEDASLYTISNFPEISTPTTKRQLRRILCDDCAEELKGRLRPVEQSVKEGEALNLRCKAEGFPPPVIEWYLDDHPIKQSKQIRIRTRKNISRLRIRKTRIEDTGRYQCIIHNALGERVFQQSSVTIESASPDSQPSHAIKCSVQSYCLNDGECWMVPTPHGKWEQFCKCTTNYTGNRCQEKEPDIITKPGTGPSRDARQFDRWMTSLGIIIGAMVLLGVAVVSYCMARKKRREHFKRRKEKLRKLKAEQDSYTNGKHRPTSRDQPNDGASDALGLKPGSPSDVINVTRMRRTLESGMQTEPLYGDSHRPGPQQTKPLYGDPHRPRPQQTEPLYGDSHRPRPQQTEPLYGDSHRPRPQQPGNLCPPNKLAQRRSAPADMSALTSGHSPRSSFSHPYVPSEHTPALTLAAFPVSVESASNIPNATVVSAVVEPDHRSSRSSPNQSQTSRTESAHLGFDADEHSHKPSIPHPVVPKHPDRSDAHVKLPAGIDPDSQSDYENEQASDMEVNIESEADLQRLDWSDEEGNFTSKLSAQQLSDDQLSDADDSDTGSSSVAEEHVLFQHMTKQSLDKNAPPVGTEDHARGERAGEAQPLIEQRAGEAQPLIEQPSCNSSHCAFNPYASHINSQYFGNFGGPSGNAMKPYSKQNNCFGSGTDTNSLLFDPDPEATAV